MRGPTAGTALFALALLTAHGPGGRVNRLPGFAGTTDGVCSGLATALELDQMLAAYEGGPPTTQAADPVAGPHQHARDLWSLNVVWDELGRFFARFDPFGHKKHREPCDDDDADKDKHQTHAHDMESGYSHSYGYDEREHEDEQDHAWATRGSRGSEDGSPEYTIEDFTPMRANATTETTPTASTSNGTTTEQRNETTPVIDDALLRGRRHRRHRQLAEPTAEADSTMIEIDTTMEPNRRRQLFSFYVVMDEVGRFFARFDPFGHKKHRDSHPEPSHDDKDGSKRLPTLYIPVPLGIIKPVSTNPPPPPPPGVGASTVLLANDTLAVNATAMASIMTADSTTRINTTAAVPTVDEAQLQGRRRRRHLLRGSDDGGKDDDAGAMPMTGTGEDDPHHGSFGLGQRLARTEEVEMLRHEQLWALPSETQKAAKPKVVGEAYERISSQSVIFLGPDADADADGAEAVAGGKAMGDSDGEAAVAAVAAEEDRAIDHERGRQLLLHHWHGHGGRADDFDDDDFDDYDDEYESEAQPAYYSKDGGDWYWQTHGFRRLQEAGEGMGMDGDDASSGAPGALMIDADDPETSVPSKRRPSAAEVLAMTPEEQAALRERDRESLENLLRKASREEEAHRSEPNVAKSLDSVLAALAMRPPADTIAESDEDTSIDDIPRRGLQAAAAGAGGQRTAALVSAMAGAISEQQKAEIRQAVYDAAVSMVREAAREVMQEASNSRGASSNSNSNSNKARAGSVGRGGGFGNGGNEDAYQAAANAILNVMARNNNNQPAMRSAVIEGVEERAGGAATAVAASRATESQGRAIDTGRGKSLLEAARAAARQSASAGRPPAGYDPYPPHRHQRRRLRGLKDATFRVPVPFTRDPSSNASNPKLVYNASDAIFINLSAREDEDGALQVTAQSMQGVGNNGDARQIPWPRIGGIGPALNGLGSNSNSGADPEGKGHTKHAWADALLKLVHKHQAGKHPSSTAAEPHASRLLEEAGAPQQPQQAQQAPAKAPEAAAPAPEPAKQPTTVGDFLQNINTKAGADGGTSAAAAGGGGSSGGGGGGGGGLDLNALAGILQRPFVPPVPGAMGTKPGETQQQPGTVDAFGNTIDEPQPAHQQGAQAPTSMMGEQEQEQEAYEEEEEEDEGDSFEPMGLGDAFYDRAASQLLSHSGSNFKKMQAVVQGIMADEGFDV